jgi:hypothetical protein
MKLPGWVVDNKTSVKREAAPWRDRSDEEHAQALAAVCRASAKILRARDDRAVVNAWVDPLPPHSIAALKRLRSKPR